MWWFMGAGTRTRSGEAVDLENYVIIVHRTQVQIEMDTTDKNTSLTLQSVTEVA